MSRYAFALAICLSLIAGCAQEGATSAGTTKLQPGTEQLASVEVGDYKLLSAIHAGSVAIVPVTYTKPIPQHQSGNFITLGEAKKAGLVEITEMGDEQVETLMVENKSDRPLLLLGGDLLLGGKQDRIVARDVVVPPGKTMKVDVYCVEHGRWDGTSEHFEYKDSVVPDKVRQAAAHRGQNAVWSEVDTYNDSAGYAGGSLTVAKGMESKAVKKQLDEHLPKVLQTVANHKDVVGFIYILNGKVQSADLFGNPRILAAARESLLKGYLLDGANAQPDPEAKVDLYMCRKFMREILKDREARAKNVANRGRSEKFDSGLAQGVELRVGEETLPASAALPAESEGFIHGNYSPKR
jgi:hypothetical protein